MASPFLRTSSTGFVNFAVPVDVKPLFGDIVGPTFSRRNVKLTEASGWAMHFFSAAEGAGAQVLRAQEVLYDMLELGEGDELRAKVKAWEPWKLAMVLAEAAVVNKGLFRRVMKARGLWKEGAPAIPTVGATESDGGAVTPPQLPEEEADGSVADLRKEVASLAATVRQLTELVASGERPAGPSSVDGRELVEVAVPPPALKFAAEATDVFAWRDAMRDDAEGLVRDLETAYVAGRQHMPGGDQLVSAFSMLRCFVLANAQTDNWDRSAELLRLGNELLLNVRLQRMYVERGLSRKALLREVQHQSDDPLEKAAAKLLTQKERQPRQAWRPRPKQGNGRGGGY
ncbi:hypothetical protein DIPPA_25588 [Diplonema papillatum]|nr:hypothetical protein DIPPA_25588 [Diplonema papillatum]